MIIHVTLRAVADISAQVEWLHLHSPQAGEAASFRVLKTIELLKHFPDLGQPLGSNLREKAVGYGRDGFIIRYLRNVDSIVILRIFHARQDR